MTFQISFGHRHSNDAREGLAARAVLIASGRDVSCIAYIDTGASVCLFQREIPYALELDLETGHRINLSTLAGTLRHMVLELHSRPWTLRCTRRSTSRRRLDWNGIYSAVLLGSTS